MWDKRKTGQRPVHISEHPLGGGIWRLSSSSDDSLLMAACMQGGLAILDLSPMLDRNSFAKCSQEKSIGYGDKGILYGSDWVPVNDRYLIATCTFYTHELLFSLYDAKIH
jgi:hypothetical protein